MKYYKLKKKRRKPQPLKGDRINKKKADTCLARGSQAELCRKRTPKMRIPDQSMRVSVTKSRQRQRPLRHQSPTKWISG